MAGVQCTVKVYNAQSTLIATSTNISNTNTIGTLLSDSNLVAAGVTEISATIGGAALSHSEKISSTLTIESASGDLIYMAYIYSPAETITGFFLDGQEYQFAGGGGGGGGGGNVIAMTQQEYNQLSSAEKNDGKLRIITDAPEFEVQSNVSGDGINIINNNVFNTIVGDGLKIGDDYSAMQGPCPKGFHVPTQDEWQGVMDIMTSKSLTSLSYYRQFLHLPTGGYRYYITGGIEGRNPGYLVWISAYLTSTMDPITNGISYVYMYSNHGDQNPYMVEKANSTTQGYSIRAFKNEYVEPTSDWIVVRSSNNVGFIFWDEINGLISITDGTKGYTMMDKNIGATAVYNPGDTLSAENCGGYFQWGNNYMFPWEGDITTSTNRVDASNYGPGNYYSSSTFIKNTAGQSDNWDSSNNTNLWGGETGIINKSIIDNNSEIVTSGDVGTSYTIRVSSSAPSIGTSRNIITFVSPLRTRQQIINMANSEGDPRTNTIAELNNNAESYYSTFSRLGCLDSGTQTGSQPYYDVSYIKGVTKEVQYGFNCIGYYQGTWAKYFIQTGGPEPA